jgi:hypothetical protein
MNLSVVFRGIILYKVPSVPGPDMRKVLHCNEILNKY